MPLQASDSPAVACGSTAVFYTETLSLFAGCCCVLFMVIGVPGNVITLLSLWRTPRLRTATTTFVLSLSAADLLFCLVNLPLTAMRYFKRCWLFGDTSCAIFGFFFYGNVATSLLSMTAITVSRLEAIRQSSKYSHVLLASVGIIRPVNWAMGCQDARHVDLTLMRMSATASVLIKSASFIQKLRQPLIFLEQGH